AVVVFFCFFFFQAEDGIRDFHVTGVQTCALPILANVKEAIRVKRLLHDVFGVLLAMDTLAALALDESDAERAAMLLGAVEANGRSEERRVGKEGRCRWAAQHVKKARERRACSAST